MIFDFLEKKRQILDIKRLIDLFDTFYLKISPIQQKHDIRGNKFVPADFLCLGSGLAEGRTPPLWEKINFKKAKLIKSNQTFSNVLPSPPPSPRLEVNNPVLRIFYFIFIGSWIGFEQVFSCSFCPLDPDPLIRIYLPRKQKCCGFGSRKHVADPTNPDPKHWNQLNQELIEAKKLLVIKLRRSIVLYRYCTVEVLYRSGTVP